MELVMRKKLVLILVIAALAVALSATIFARSRGTAAKVAAAGRQQQGEQQQIISGPGRVEPLSEDIKLGSELSGKLKSVRVEEGDHVTSGQLLAELQNDDYRAQIGSAEAQVIAKEATLRKVLNGARVQERSEAMSSVRAAQAVMNNARAEMERRQKLFAAGVISREENERYSRQYDVAKAKYEEAAEHHSLVDDRAREEDRAFAEADLQLARASLEEARARYAKTLLKSPIDGTVLRKHHRSGESVSNSSTVPDPIVTIGDKHVLRVRVDVDETEVGKVHVGQRAYVTADAFAGQKFWGRVVRVGEQLGRKNVRTDEPTERVDTKILETLVELDKGAQLPVGLRVDAFILGDRVQTASAK
jgi:HlyD family secretion protein